MINTGQLYPSHNAENVLGFELPDDYGGQLWKYQVGHSVLLLKFTGADLPWDDALYVGFEMVWYLDLPSGWRGGNLRTATREECLALLLELDVFKNDEMESAEFRVYTLKTVRLFVIESSRKPCRILASAGVNISKEPYI